MDRFFQVLVGALVLVSCLAINDESFPNPMPYAFKGEEIEQYRVWLQPKNETIEYFVAECPSEECGFQNGIYSLNFNQNLYIPGDYKILARYLHTLELVAERDVWISNNIPTEEDEESASFERRRLGSRCTFAIDNDVNGKTLTFNRGAGCDKSKIKIGGGAYSGYFTDVSRVYSRTSSGSTTYYAYSYDGGHTGQCSATLSVSKCSVPIFAQELVADGVKVTFSSGSHASFKHCLGSTCTPTSGPVSYLFYTTTGTRTIRARTYDKSGCAPSDYTSAYTISVDAICIRTH
eukprot:TRINITY_DN340_c0_g1_i1.p1 TRINITY_DN340_c0_g1~~TRINITY_DN340_c0_g1_i1.p1  ORF type:complete len:291 (+),score=34.22 TRINITY_DN340_c0_g1_i1:72-944(+)